MATIAPWCVIVNLKTCNPRVWRTWQIKFDLHNLSYEAYLTDSIEALREIIELKLKEGHRYFLFAGGDGTLHHGGNILMQISKQESSEIVIGVLPCGTGNDWLRTFGVHPRHMIQALQERRIKPLHVLRLVWPDGRERYAFNMVGGALDALVVQSLSSSFFQYAGKLKYGAGLIRSLLKSHTWNAHIKTNDKSFNGTWLTIQAGFGKYCGGGMYVLPHAEDLSPALLLMRPKSLWRILQSLPKLYNGKINDQPEATAILFTKLEISHNEDPVPFEADGEWLGYSPLTIYPVLGAMQRLSS